MDNAINQQADGNTWMVGMTAITRENLDSGKIVHTEWNPSRDAADQCGVNVVDYFDASGKFLGPDENGLEPTFAEAE
jgi:hypothetical protein